MLRAVILAVGVSAAVAVYFIMSLYVMPQTFRDVDKPVKPGPLVSDVTFSAQQMKLGDKLAISVTGINSGDTADRQIISVGFPNLTSTSDIEIIRQDFRQTPMRIEIGNHLSSGYTAGNTVLAQYPSIEAYSSPWEHGKSYTLDLQVEPQTDGKFIFYVKSVAFPHSWEGAHYPQVGPVDFQQEFVNSYSVMVTKS